MVKLFIYVSAYYKHIQATWIEDTKSGKCGSCIQCIVCILQTYTSSMNVGTVCDIMYNLLNVFFQQPLSWHRLRMVITTAMKTSVPAAFQLCQTKTTEISGTDCNQLCLWLNSCYIKWESCSIFLRDYYKQVCSQLIQLRENCFKKTPYGKYEEQTPPVYSWRSELFSF